MFNDQFSVINNQSIFNDLIFNCFFLNEETIFFGKSWLILELLGINFLKPLFFLANKRQACATNVQSLETLSYR